MEHVSENILKFSREAYRYPESVPMGNGRIGAMIFGDIERETIVMNEKGMWSGSVCDNDREDAYEVLPKIRRLLLNGDNAGAEDLVKSNFVCKGVGSNYAHGARVPFGCYQMMAYLRLYFFQYSTLSGQDEGIFHYARELDLENALSTVTYCRKSGGGTAIYRREAFVSAPDQVFAMRICCDKPGKISFSARLDRPECAETAAQSGDLILTGQLPDGQGTDKGVRFACRLRIVSQGGRVWTQGDTLQVQDADSACVYVTAITDIHTFSGRRSETPVEQTLKDMDAALAYSFDGLKRRHVEEYQSYYKRMRFSLEERGDSAPELDVAGRILRLKAGKSDTGLETLLFNFDRYLFISANRPGELPGNLQGLWAEELLTPWNGDWHLNAQQMLFWPAEICGLPELHMPYLELTRALVEPGKKTARLYYNARGWVVHTFTNPWLFTAPGEDAAWGATTGSAAWQCFHLWQHFVYTGDTEFLKWAYPVMKEAAAFYQDMLITEPGQGFLVTAPSSSPENLFVGTDGKSHAVCMGPTYDNQLLRFLFNACADAADLLALDADLAQKWRDAAKRLPPTRAGADGRIMEWLEDYKEALPNHRHISHLWGLYPGYEISPDADASLADAAVRTLQTRGTTSAGWSISHRLGAWIRLGQGEEAYRCFIKILRDASYPNLFGRCYHAPENDPDPEMPPLNDFYHPFQMDANCGVAGCLPEMAAQGRVLSYGDIWSVDVRLLCAIPQAWKGGSLSGICLPGGVRVDISWRDGELDKAAVFCDRTVNLLLRLKDKSISVRVDAGRKLDVDKKLCPELF